MANSSFLRKKIKSKRKGLKKNIVVKKSDTIIKKLIKQPFFNYYHSIFLYYSFLNEVSTRKLFAISRIKGKKTGFPVVRNREIIPVLTEKNSFKKGSFKIMEPVDYKEFVFNNKTIIIIPLIIFDNNCNRIGFGKGFYDRLLKKVKGLKVGLAYEFQRQKIFKKKYYDVKLDMIITEKRIIRRKK